MVEGSVRERDGVQLEQGLELSFLASLSALEPFLHGSSWSWPRRGAGQGGGQLEQMPEAAPACLPLLEFFLPPSPYSWKWREAATNRSVKCWKQQHVA